MIMQTTVEPQVTEVAATLPAGRTQRTLRHAAFQLRLAEQAYQVAVERIALLPGELVGKPGAQFAAARMRGSLASMAALLDRQSGLVAGESGAGLAQACIAAVYLAQGSQGVLAEAFDMLGDDVDGVRRLQQISFELRSAPAPVPADLARELIGKAALGIDPDEKPRWV
jgi:hypothetical protein